MPEDFLFEGRLSDVDPEVAALIERETFRQRDKIQMIASESLCPPAVLTALASSFNNKYAEGYPPAAGEESPLLRRYGERRYYKGVEFCDQIEILAQRRLASLFATEAVPASKIFANVQALSGAPANNAVYSALLQPGDPVLGMNLSHGGHLTHGSPANRSGKVYRVTPYGVNAAGRIDYDEVLRLARQVRPRMIVGGASAYPWPIDWARLRAACDEVGAYLLADIAHTAGLVVAGLFPNPVGIAHATTFTTHKTLCGPRGGAILTTDPEIAKKIDSAVFPGEQGGPHMHQIAAKAVAFRLAATPAFRRLQERIVENCAALARAFEARGLPLAYGGTATHLCLLDLRRLEWTEGPRPDGEVAAEILDLCGITCNKNTLAGDTSPVRPGGLRFGTVIVTQRGMGPAEMESLADLVARVLRAIRTRAVPGKVPKVRGTIEGKLLRRFRDEVRALSSRFPPFAAGGAPEIEADVSGEAATAALRKICPGADGLAEGESGPADIVAPDGASLGRVVVRRQQGRYRLEGVSPDLSDWFRWLVQESRQG